MNKTVLVIGEVTRNQYQDARIKLMHEKHAPRIMRINPDSFFMSITDLIEKYLGLDFDNAEALVHDSENESFLHLVSTHLGSYGSIGAIVFEEKCWERWGTCGSDFLHLEEYFTEGGMYPDRWIASSDGRVEYAGIL